MVVLRCIVDDEELRNREILEYREQYYKDFIYIHKGRMKRLDFFFSVFLVNALGNFLSKNETEGNFLFFVPIYFFLAYLGINFICKRVRDIGLSAWWAIIPAVFASVLGVIHELATEGVLDRHFFDDNIFLAALLVVGVVFILPLYFWPSQKRDNRGGAYYPYSSFGGYKAPKEPKPKKRRAL